MHAKERLIRERFARQKSAECGTALEQEGVLVLARRRTAWMVLVTCSNCEHRGIFVVSFPDAPDAPPVDAQLSHYEYFAEPSAAAPSAQQPPSPGPVTLEEVAQMREFLAGFDGNFQRIFSSR